MPLRRAFVALLALPTALMGCGGASVPETAVANPETPASPAETPASPAEIPTSPVAIPASPADLLALDATARAGAVVETIHGVEVSDPYRALEADTPATWSWIDAQSAYTQAFLDAHADPYRAERLGQLFGIGYYSGAIVAQGNVFFLKSDGQHDQPVLYVLERGAESPRALIDPNGLEANTALDWFFPSPGGTYVAYGLSHNGDERSTLHILETASGHDLGETIDHTKWADLEWLNDESGFYYTRYPRSGEPDYDASEEDTYNRFLFFHAVGSDPAADPLVFRTNDRTDFVSTTVGDTDDIALLAVFRGWSASDLYLLDRTTPGATPTPLSVGGDSIIWGYPHHGRLFLYSNEGHPRGRILTAPLATAADPSTWTEIVPEGEGTLESFAPAGDTLVAQYVVDVAARLTRYDLDGHALGDIELPVHGSVSALTAEPGSTDVVFAFDSYFYPPTLFRFSPDAGVVQLDRVAADIDPDAYELEQTTVPSADGTPINVFLVHQRDLVRDGNTPVLLTGYGGFNSSMMPAFTRNALYWVERGGVYAVANLRGGGEFGEDWHQAGMLENKHHVFEDFEAVIRWLSSSGLSRPERIAITGASNGGLLMGAMITRCPDAFRAVVSDVGLYDMVRFSQFPPAAIWTAEYGDPADADAFNWLYAYSPYHHVVDGTAYPAILIETADSDTRVAWQHSTKFAARLQAATSSDLPVLFYMGRHVGHGAGTSRSDTIRQYDRLYTFVETELGVAP